MDGMCARLRATVGFTYTMLLLSSYIPVLSGQRVAVIRRLAFMMKPRVFNKGDLLIREGDAAKEVFFLVLGEVAVSHLGQEDEAREGGESDRSQGGVYERLASSRWSRRKSTRRRCIARLRSTPPIDRSSSRLAPTII